MRKDDTEDKTYFRSEDRLFQIDGNWWFAVRKNERGPHASRVLAQQAMVQHILDVRGNIELNEISRLAKNQKELSGWDLVDN